MAKPRSILWKIEPHTKAKHAILLRYLQAWFPILASTKRPLLYIDGFCGPGRYIGGEDGSPLVALKAAISAKVTVPVDFWFIDENQDRLNHLHSELKDFPMPIPPNFQINAKAGDFTSLYPEILKSDEAFDTPTFAFIDPFGFKDIPYDIVTELLKRRSCEILVNVMVEFMNRFLETDDKKTRHHIISAFGTPECLNIIERKDQDRMTLMRDLYEHQLEQSAKFVRSFEMADQHEKTKYYLFFATNNRLGHKKMKEAMWHVDPAGEFKFTDRSNRQLVVLGDKVHNYSDFLSFLEDAFADQGFVEFEKIQEFVIDRTVFLPKHLLEALKRAESTGKIEVSNSNSDGTKRRRNSFAKSSIRFTRQEQLKLNLL